MRGMLISSRSAGWPPQAEVCRLTAAQQSTGSSSGIDRAAILPAYGTAVAQFPVMYPSRVGQDCLTSDFASPAY
jgi:hypothetical protein